MTEQATATNNDSLRQLQVDIDKVVGSLPPEHAGPVAALVKSLVGHITDLTNDRVVSSRWYSTHAVPLTKARVNLTKLQLAAATTACAARDKRLDQLALAIYSTEGSEAEQLATLRQAGLEVLGVAYAVSASSGALDDAMAPVLATGSAFTEAAEALSNLFKPQSSND